MIDLSNMVTEARNPKTMNLDEMPPLDLIRIMNEEDEKVIQAVKTQVEKIARIVEWCTRSLEGAGRLIYMGAGTSGRMGLLDAAECPPTFGVEPEKVVGLIAGGKSAFIKAVEGAEDSEALGEEDLRSIHLTADDVVIGIAASGRTPYVLGGLRYAGKTGCRTAAIVCNTGSAMAETAEITVELVVGPEILTGSTRLKAGTAEKMVCNMISTASMVGTGKAYQNLMVDVVQTNTKLIKRAENIVMEATGCSRNEAQEALACTDGHAKTAIVSILSGCRAQEAREKLAKAHGHVRYAIEQI
ncbi:MAG: N-acetylmuramic acid 6-phosphate etherase [Hungatella sp.]|nr:N-acetylmuramic acid 6-phosphate etherase [Hungatella sp.]